jgi:hypothetical protein
MPAWGLIPDSPVIYWAGKGLKAGSKARSGSSLRARGSVSLEITKLVIYKPVLNYELNVPSGMVGKHMHKIGKKILIGARKQVGVQTGVLRGSLFMQHQGFSGRGQSLKIGSGLSYAEMHHQGTRPHIITPTKPGGNLVFRKGSRIIHARIVNHPGTKPNRFLSDQLIRYIR